ncbi:ClpXP protease specificity-enhancing factor [Legionella israelensis]|uniref:ClpXP protease specificity-enhancing factor n=1 Tax=Legionella israelensis TaxID=454 RepID=A0AAX1EDV5_9GAMM|nr:ClpXP protease specificity-enhancing factor [Legionella israelensis]QBR83291.1 ClpXP protease specificity-enhancing factor [Legionella israelensis]
MTSNRPYLIRAFYDWIVDNNMTPYILVDANYPGVQVPGEHVQDGRIVLNISPSACRGLMLENDRIIFTTKFSGQSMQISLAPGAVLEIYAKENGRGISFPPEEDETPPPSSTNSDKISRKKPSLKLVE